MYSSVVGLSSHEEISQKPVTYRNIGKSIDFLTRSTTTIVVPLLEGPGKFNKEQRLLESLFNASTKIPLPKHPFRSTGDIFFGSSKVTSLGDDLAYSSKGNMPSEWAFEIEFANILRNVITIL